MLQLQTFSKVALIGSRTQRRDNNLAEADAVAQIVIHPNYNSDATDYDFCLLRLPSVRTFNRFSSSQQICLPANASDCGMIGAMANVTGWGRTNTSSNATSKDLVKVFRLNPLI